MNFLTVWDYVRYIKKEGAWGDYTKMHPSFLLALDFIQGDLGKEYDFVLHCGWEGSGHAPNSFHYKGMAIDFHVFGCDALVALPKILKSVNKLKKPFAIGYYPWWAHKGFHFDMGGRIRSAYWVSPCKEVYKYQLNQESMLAELGLH